jgi:hypothetical protein
VTDADLALSFEGSGPLVGSDTLGGIGMPVTGGVLNLALASAVPVPGLFVVEVLMPPSMQTTLGSSLRVVTSSSASAGNLKALVQAATELDSALQTLYAGGAALVDDQTLGDAGIVSGGFVLLALGLLSPPPPPMPPPPPPTRPSVMIALPVAPVLLQQTFGSLMPVIASVSSSVAQVKAAVSAITGLSLLDIGLGFGGVPDLANEALLGESGVPASGGILNLTLPSSLASAWPSESPPFIVKVLMPPGLQPAIGSVLTMMVSPGSTAEELKARIGMVTGLATGEQALFFGGRDLSSGITLADAGIPSGATLRLELPTLMVPAEIDGYLHVALPSSLHDAFGMQIMVQAKPQSSVRLVKLACAAITAVEASDQVIFYVGLAADVPGYTPAIAGRRLGHLGGSGAALTDAATLASVGVPHVGGLMEMALGGGAVATPPACTVDVITSTSLQAAFGSKLTFGINLLATFLDVKMRVEVVTGLSVPQQDLFYRGAAPDGSTPLGVAGVQCGSALLLVQLAPSPPPAAPPSLPPPPPSPPPPTVPRPSAPVPAPASPPFSPQQVDGGLDGSSSNLLTTCVDSTSGEGCFPIWGLVLLLALLLCCWCCCLLFWLCARRRRREKKGERVSIIDLIWHHRMLTQKDLGLSTNLADVSAAEMEVEIHMDHIKKDTSRPLPPPMDEDVTEVKDISVKQVRLSTQMVSRAYSEKIRRKQVEVVEVTEVMRDEEEGVLSEDEPE